MDKRRKELLFLGAGLLVLLVALYFTFKPSTPAAEATAQAPAAGSTAQTAAAPAGPTEPSAQIEPSAVPVPMSEGGTTVNRNPFAPVIATTIAKAPGSSPPSMIAMRAPSLPPIEPMRLQLFQPEGGPASATGSASGVITPTPAAPVDAPLRLTGVIYGDPSMAIIRKGDKRYFVRPGDPVGNRYVVQTISHRRVVLASSQGTLSLDLTGRL
jgi:hypothetical protein